MAVPVSRLSVDLFHEFYQPRQGCQSLIQHLPIRNHLQRVHSGVSMGAETLTYHIFCADEVSFEHQFIRDTRRSRFALLLEPQILHLKRHIRVSGALIHVVIKIMLPRSHGPKCERETRLPGSNQALNIVRERNHSASDLQIKVGEGAACLCSPGSDGIEKQRGMFRHEGSAEPAAARNRIQLPQLDILAKRKPRWSYLYKSVILALFNITQKLPMVTVPA